ncbi:hypothetical protein [Halococcus qingdaonensis]|uniref:hypothetical protein n=1 Tax=Halococcus qingdaonensis TaxID=224402 RepID=UPI002116E238|nr:hypothetical protein [Halococcus qingdaonensis]
MANKVAAGEYNSDEEDDLGLEPRITNVTPLHPEVEPLNSKTQLTVRTTDIFGGNYPGVDVDISKVNGSGNLSTNTATSDGDGNVTFAYDPAAADSGSTVGITAELANASGDNSSVTFGLNYPPASGPSRCNLGAELESPGFIRL